MPDWHDSAIRITGLRVSDLEVCSTDRSVHAAATRPSGSWSEEDWHASSPLTRPGRRRWRSWPRRRRASTRATPTPGGKPSRSWPIMAELGRRFLEEYVPTQCKPSTQGEYRRSVTLFIDPAIDGMRISVQWHGHQIPR